MSCWLPGKLQHCHTCNSLPQPHRLRHRPQIHSCIHLLPCRASPYSGQTIDVEAEPPKGRKRQTKKQKQQEEATKAAAQELTEGVEFGELVEGEDLTEGDQDDEDVSFEEEPLTEETGEQEACTAACVPLRHSLLHADTSISESCARHSCTHCLPAVVLRGVLQTATQRMPRTMRSQQSLQQSLRRTTRTRMQTERSRLATLSACCQR